MKTTSEGFVLFHSMHAAFVLEKALKSSGVAAELVPTPRHLSSDCGTALKFHTADRDGVESAISETNLEVVGIFEE